MAATYYMSIGASAAGSVSDDPDHYGTAATATDAIELRIGDGTRVPTRREALLAMKRFERWIMTATFPVDLPPPTGEV